MVSRGFQKRLSSSWMALLLFIVGYWPQKLHRSMGVLSIPTTFRCSSASGLSYRASRNAEILALRILAEIDLNRADLLRDTFIEPVWSFEQRNPPTKLYPIGRQMLRSFQHVKRSAREKWLCLFCLGSSRKSEVSWDSVLRGDGS